MKSEVMPRVVEVICQRLEQQFMALSETDPMNPTTRLLPPLARRARNLYAAGRQNVSGPSAEGPNLAALSLSTPTRSTPTPPTVIGDRRPSGPHGDFRSGGPAVDRRQSGPIADRRFGGQAHK